MMREKVDIYRQYAANLLGNAESAFYTPFGSATSTDRVDNALVLSFRRLFTRDRVKRETFAIKMYYSASSAGPGSAGPSGTDTLTCAPNLNVTSEVEERIFTDFGSAQNRRRTFGGEVGDLVNSADTTNKVGLVFYDSGTVLLNVDRIISSSQYVSGVVGAMNNDNAGPDGPAVGFTYLGGKLGGANSIAKFVPDLMVSASIDDIVDHFASCRFSSGSLTATTFQNNTNINSTLIFCRATADEFNYSSNPTYTNASNKLVVIDQGQEDVQRSFSFISTVGLYDANDNLLAVAKLSPTDRKE